MSDGAETCVYVYLFSKTDRPISPKIHHCKQVIFKMCSAIKNIYYSDKYYDSIYEYR